MPSDARTRHKGGTKYKPTDQDRRTVAAMVGVGIPQNDICAVLDVTVPTLHKHFRKELDTSYARVLARLRGKLVAKADAGDTACLIFYCQTHGWNQRLTVVDGGKEADPATLSDADLEARIARLARPGRDARLSAKGKQRA